MQSVCALPQLGYSCTSMCIVYLQECLHSLVQMVPLGISLATLSLLQIWPTKSNYT